MPTTGTRVFTTFGLQDVAIAVPTETPGVEPTWLDLPSVESAAFKLNVSEVEQWGDDTYQGVFYHSQKGTIAVKFNKLSMAIFETLSGNSVATISTSGEKMYFGTNLELIPPQVVIRAKTGYRDATSGQAKLMTVYYYKCDVKTPWDSFPGGERAKIGENTLSFNSFSSTVDHLGNPVVGVDYAFGHFEV